MVSAIFKKGDPASCENYRPISLLAIGYKLFATILLRRLNAAGADARIWPTQFGFRIGRGCADALFVARRLLERTRAAKDGSVVFLALDWAKAFDSSILFSAARLITPLAFPAPCVTVHEANEWKKKKVWKTPPAPQTLHVNKAVYATSSGLGIWLHMLCPRQQTPFCPIAVKFDSCVRKRCHPLLWEGFFFFGVGPVLRRTVLVFVRWCFCLFVLCFVCC